ncbi:tripartite tricarboxylate transporter TctB family protein [Arthrobacter russicus]|uniref:Tricarboxylic transport membrane protein n=1 Tax=Arthrobacter russicus TaxID=172040 RepID=A0ABU1JE21_9MICC|nr:tripartite tricarboxylate transporter TctB family protein [Arthrobacter russicus]MDR6270687.1 putative tricarboxylic transport membrane protein [Arthrobacter russicus]
MNRKAKTIDRTGAAEPSGLSELIIAGFAIATAVFLTIGTSSMQVTGSTFPGPQFFPSIVAGLLYAVGAFLAFQTIRRAVTSFSASRSTGGEPAAVSSDFSANLLEDLADVEHGTLAEAAERASDDQPSGVRYRTHTDWKTVGIVLGSLVAFALLLIPVGWLVSAALLFWGVCYALGSKRPLFDAGVALLFSGLIQIAFGGLLGLALPAGFLEGLL